MLVVGFLGPGHLLPDVAALHQDIGKIKLFVFHPGGAGRHDDGVDAFAFRLEVFQDHGPAFGAAEDVSFFDVLDFPLFFDHLREALKIYGIRDATALAQIYAEFLFDFHHDLLPRAMRLLRAAPVPSCTDLVTSRGPFKVPTA